MMEASAEQLDVRIYPHDHIFVFQTSWWDLLNERIYYDAVIHTTAIMNLSTEPLTIERLTIEAHASNQLVSRHIWQANDLLLLAEPIRGRINAGLGRILELVLFMHQALPTEVELASSSTLMPNEALAIPNIYLSFHILPDKLTLIVDTVDKDGKNVNAQTELRAIEYLGKNEYTFPVKGCWFMKAYPETGRLDHHRFGVSNEFGVDLLKLGADGELFKNNGILASDWYSYGEMVFAAASGKVAMVHTTAVQEWTRFHPTDCESEDDFQQRALRQAQAALAGDVLDWAAGNYIVIEHSGGEFSSYLHLKEGSVRVKEGDEVKEGDHIAEVGNTGDSYGAHLHFQITNSKDLINGRSLPFSFKGISVDLEEPGKFVRSVS
jgi:murein DD-endopeptidase MepM/ murein hydrolase activator NlpD